MTSRDLLGISTDKSDHPTIIIRLAGELDLAGFAAALTTCQQEISRDGARRVVIDLSKLRFVDPAGARAIAAAYLLGYDMGVAVDVRGATGSVEQVLLLLDLIEMPGLASPELEAPKRTGYRRT